MNCVLRILVQNNYFKMTFVLKALILMAFSPMTFDRRIFVLSNSELQMTFCPITFAPNVVMSLVVTTIIVMTAYNYLRSLLNQMLKHLF